MKKAIIIFGLIAVVGVSIYTAINYKNNLIKVHEEREISLLLESVKDVTQLVNIESNISELIRHEDYFAFDWWPFRKKAIVRVQAKVLIGTDFTDTRFLIEPDIKRVIVRTIPQSKILAIDSKVDYFDIQEGTFNSFSPNDYNKMNQLARQTIEVKVAESSLIQRADEKRDQLLKSLASTIEAQGWQVELVYDGLESTKN